ncbi:MAG: hypothetical protein ACTJGH_02515 [Peptoniphilaceae bacterium]
MAEKIEENINLEKDFIVSDEILRINNVINSILKRPYNKVFRIRIDRELRLKNW